MKKLFVLLLSLCLLSLTACASVPAATPLPSEDAAPTASHAAETPVPTDEAISTDAPAETTPAESGEATITGPVLVNSYTAKLDVVENVNNADGSYRELLTGDGRLFLEFERALPDGSDAKAALENAILQANPTLLSVDAMQDDVLTKKLTYPVFTAHYETGSNEDALVHEDLCFVTDSYVYFFRCSAPIDSWEDYAEDVEMYRSGLALFDPAA